jgi:CRISPR/Cas system-associated endoribonuclease Cas2
MKDALIKNEFDGPINQLDKFDRKYLRFIQDTQMDRVQASVFAALRSKDIKQIESSLVNVANNMRSNLFLIGLSCLIIERENLYRNAGCRSYLEYSGRLFEKLELAPQTLSDAKNIMAAYIDHYKELSKHGFKLGRNAHKLRFLEKALENHADENEVYSQITNATFREFVDWAQPTPAALPPPEPKIKIKIDGGKILIDGKNILNIPATVPEKIKESVTRDLTETFRIRASGNEPFIVETYDKGEQRAIDTFLKNYRAKK